MDLLTPFDKLYKGLQEKKTPNKIRIPNVLFKILSFIKIFTFIFLLKQN